MKKPRKDHYETLGLSKDATPEQIKKARKKKAAAAHPDLGGDHETMAAINHAADVLSNPERRRLYDTTGEDEQRPPLDKEARAPSSPRARARCAQQRKRTSSRCS